MTSLHIHRTPTADGRYERQQLNGMTTDVNGHPSLDRGRSAVDTRREVRFYGRWTPLNELRRS